MSGRGSAARGMILTVIWLTTAAVALILTVVYFEKLQRLYANADEQISVVSARAAQAEDKEVRNTPSLKAETGGESPAAFEPETGTNALDSPGMETGIDPEISFTQDLYAGTDPENSAGEGAYAGADPEVTINDADPEDALTQDLYAGADPETFSADDPSAGSINAADTKGTGTEAETLNPDYDYTLGVDPNKPMIALTFDDGPGTYTKRIVDTLVKYNVKSTFFMVGYNVENFKDTVKKVYDAGMEIGNHSSAHRNLTELSIDDIRGEIYNNEDLINSVVPAGKLPVRTPYGMHNSTVRTVIRRPMFNWSVDSLDWKTRDAESIVAQIQQDASDGYIVLMHDLYESTAEATERIVPWLIENGYQIVCQRYV